MLNVKSATIPPAPNTQCTINKVEPEGNHTLGNEDLPQRSCQVKESCIV